MQPTLHAIDDAIRSLQNLIQWLSGAPAKPVAAACVGEVTTEARRSLNDYSVHFFATQALCRRMPRPRQHVNEAAASSPKLCGSGICENRCSNTSSLAISLPPGPEILICL